MTTIPDLNAALDAILGCVEARLTADGRPVALSSLRPGGVPATWDNCCEGGGQLWVRLVEVYPSRQFPNPDSLALCGVDQLAARVGVGIIRCAHGLDENGNTPTAAQMTDDAHTVTADAMSILTALTCCVDGTVGNGSIKIGAWTPLGPKGGCAGGEWSLAFAALPCACPEE